MSTSAKASYHHGDLRSSLLKAAMGLLEAGEPFSLRAIAREAGVSATAPYRHFTDRDALESALAAQGLRDLKDDLLAGREMPTQPSDLADFAVAYVEFGLSRPELFRLMFNNACDEGNADRVQAAEEIRELLRIGMGTVYPDGDADDLATGGWALAHGLAYLFLDGKLPAESDEEIADRVRTAFSAVLSIH